MDVIPCGIVEEACDAAGPAVTPGDYVTGPNHILPTAGAAWSTGGLSVRLKAHTASLALRVDGDGE
jgi:Histidinol dehydrogenase